MTGFKVFIKKRKYWSGPVYPAPRRWHDQVKAGGILTEPKLDTYVNYSCEPGIHFFKFLKDAKEFISVVESSDKAAVIYAVETLGRVVGTLDGVSPKVRTDKLKLLYRVVTGTPSKLKPDQWGFRYRVWNWRKA